MAQGHISIMETEDERLNVVGAARAGSGVAHMANRPVSLQTFDFSLVAEHLGQQTPKTSSTWHRPIAQWLILPSMTK